MRIDAHQHFWRYQASDFPWIGDTMSCLQRDFLPQDLAAERYVCSVGGSIAVQARPQRAETDFLLAVADEDASIVGVVGWIDPVSDDLEAQLSRWQSPRLRGFRHLIQDEASPSNYLRSKNVQRGVQTLQRLGFSYDVLVTAAHLPATYDFCAACDHYPLILDHLGKPNIRDSEFDAWRREFMRLGELPHVACKLSGLVTEADWQHWQPHELWPYLDVALETFGENRLLFGSDWPVCLIAGSYHDVFALIDDWASERGFDKRKLFGRNAQRLYGLNVPASLSSGANA